ncbi:MAG: FtsX-like permease family protein [Treponema sp.]
MKEFLSIIFALRFIGIGSAKGPSNARLSLLGASFGIGISIIPLIVVLVVSDGMIAGIAERTIELGTGQMQVIDMQPSSYFPNCENELALKTRIKKEIKDSYFVDAWVQREGQGLLIGKKARSGGVVRAIEKDFFIGNEKAKSLIKIIDGSLLFEEDNSIILGEKIAEKLGLSVGDVCRLITLRESYNGKTIPKLSLFKVMGIISSGYQELDALWIFIPLSRGIEILSSSSSINSLIISTKDPFNQTKLNHFLEELEKKILFWDKLPSTFSIYSWDQLNKATFYSFSTTKNLILFIVFLITLVASINIAQALVMLVMERKNEIAILKANGASPQFITMCFLTAGLITSLLGLIIGMPIGILISLHVNSILSVLEKGINYFYYYASFILGDLDVYSEVHLLDPSYYLETIPVSINFYELYFISIITLLLSVIVSLIPSIRAGREKPLVIMRKR